MTEMLRKPVTLLVAGLLLLALASATQGQEKDKVDVKDLVQKSDAFFAKVGEGKLSEVKDWEEELGRLQQVEKAIGKDAKSLLQVKVYRRLGVTHTFLSKGKGSKEADSSFNQALAILQALHKDSPVKGNHEMMATLLKERADNAILQGEPLRATTYLKRALASATDSTLKGELGEATIRERLAGVYFRGENWKDSLDTIVPAIEILDATAKKLPKFDKEALRSPLWYVAVSKSRLKQDAEKDFDRYLTEFKDKLSPHDLADAYREKAVNIGELSPKDEGKERTAALKRAHAVILEAKTAIDKSKDDKDALQKYVILSDLAMSHWRQGERKEAEANFKSALEVATKAQGKDWPGLLPVMRRYADLLKVLGRGDDEGALRKEIDRIEALRKK